MASLALDENHERLIRKQLETGRYEDASDVVSAALEMLDGADDGFDRWLREEIPARLAELREDPTIGIPADIVHAELEARHHARIAKDK
jgi:antitoxin ParD1/3/4